MSQENDDDEDGMLLRTTMPDLVPKVVELVQSATDDEKRRLLQTYPELLTDDADDLLGQIEEAHRSKGNKASANSINGLRFKLESTRKYGFEHACLEQVVLGAFLQMPLDATDSYLDHITELFPELLSPKTEAAIEALKGHEAGPFRGVKILGFFDKLLQKIQEQRKKNSGTTYE